jgi:hypothetical protein
VRVAEELRRPALVAVGQAFLGHQHLQIPWYMLQH